MTCNITSTITICPICGKNNHCGVKGASIGDCWCQSATIAPAALAKVPPPMKGSACICPSCAGAPGVPASER